MGVENDQEIAQMVGRDPKYAGILAPFTQECVALSIYSKQQALEYLGSKVKSSRNMWVKANRSKVDEARDILANVVLAHIPVIQYDFRNKCIYIAVMMRRMLEAMLNSEAVATRTMLEITGLSLLGSFLPCYLSVRIMCGCQLMLGACFLEKSFMLQALSLSFSMEQFLECTEDHCVLQSS